MSEFIRSLYPHLLREAENEDGKIRRDANGEHPDKLVRAQATLAAQVMEAGPRQRLENKKN